METPYSATLSEHYSDLAHHYRRSANTEKAITYLQLAGQQAVQRSANPEAISHLTAALELLMTRPETRERAAQELMLRLAVGPALIATQGWAAPQGPSTCSEESLFGLGRRWSRAWRFTSPSTRR